MGPTCQSLTLSSPCFFLCRMFAVMALRALPKPPPLCLAVVEGDPVFPAVGRRQVAHAAFPSSPLAFTPSCALSLSSTPKAREQSKRATLLDPKIRPPNRHGFQIQRAQGSFIFLASFPATPTSAPTRQTLELRISPPPEPPWRRREPHVARPPLTIPAATNYTNRVVVIS